jgi:hypothetical protein
MLSLGLNITREDTELYLRFSENLEAQTKLQSSIRAVFRNLISPAAHPNLSKTYDGTPQNFA